MSEYKVKVLKNGGWANHNVARIGISMNNPKQTGAKFAALIDWLKPRFDHVILQIADSLHRHNIQAQDNLSEHDAHKASLQLGDAWLTANSPCINTLNSYEIIRWDQRLQANQFKESYTKIIDLLEKQSDVTIDMQRYINNYAKRKGQATLVSLNDAFHSAARNYVAEESAVYMDLFDTEPAAEIYPGSYLPLPEHPNKSFTSIDFVKRKPR